MEMKRRMLQKAEAPAIGPAAPLRKPELPQWLSRVAKTPQLCAEKASKTEDGCGRNKRNFT
jgi:hypothetical protein